MASTAQGKRKEKAKLLPIIKDAPRLTHGMQLPEETDLREVTILSAADWQRIQYHLYRKEIEERKMRKKQEEKEKIIETSKNMVKNWTNTLSGQRQKKLENRRLREIKDEEVRKFQDIEEKEYQAQLRKEILDNARALMFFETDRVKRFHGALRLTETMKEREAQIELRKLSGDNKKKYEKYMEEEYAKINEKEIRKEKEREYQRIKANYDNVEFVKSQIKEKQKIAEKNKELYNLEGMEIQTLFAEYEADMKKMKEIQAVEQQKLLQDNIEQIIHVKKIKDIQDKQEMAIDEECRVFAKAKTNMLKMRFQREKELYNLKQEQLNKIRKKLAEQIEGIAEEEDERIQKAAAEIEEKQREEEEEKEEKRRKSRTSIFEHRQQKMTEDKEKKTKQKQAEYDWMQSRKEADALYHKNEHDKNNKRKTAAINLSKFHLMQKDEKKKQEVDEKIAYKEFNRANRQLMLEEEEQFQKYAQKIIKQCEENGRHVYPLKYAALRPRYLPPEENDKQESTGQSAENDLPPKDSKKNLGFVW